MNPQGNTVHTPGESASSPSILGNARHNFDRTAAALAGEVPSDVLAKVRRPRECIALSLTPQLGDARVHVFDAYIVRHSDALGPSKGGIRMSGAVTMEDVIGLAMEMTWKCALIGVPFGGGKSGIVAEPEALAPADKEKLIRSFARNAHRHIGPQVYVPAPDMGTGETDMGYIKDAISYSMGWATTQGCYVTGKPVILGGIPGRREATGRGVTMAVGEACRAIGLKLDGAAAVVQGFGNVGSVAAAALAEMGARVIAVGDVHGAVYNPRGLDVAALSRYAAAGGSVAGFAGGAQVSGADMLELPCDILVPAAAANQITAANAPRIGAKVVAEGANSPTSPQADRILQDRGVLVVPDILCNAGGVYVSYLEYTQETQQEQMPEEVVLTRLRDRMVQRFAQVRDLAQSRGLTLRDAAMCLAVRTVCQAVVARGYQP